MLKVLAVCSGNTCRSPLLGAALNLISDKVSVRTACAPYYKEDDSRPLPCMPKAFEDAANQLIKLGVVKRERRKRLKKIVSKLTKHKAKLFENLKPQPAGDEIFVAADKHLEKLTTWAQENGRPKLRIWEDDVSLIQAVGPFSERLAGHQQISDAYLLGLVIHRKGKLATLDRGVLTLLEEKSSDRHRVVII